jgi:hypothetical protein
MYETYWGMLQGDLLKEYEAEKEKLIAEKETEEKNLASINSLLEALAV